VEVEVVDMEHQVQTVAPLNVQELEFQYLALAEETAQAGVVELAEAEVLAAEAAGITAEPEAEVQPPEKEIMVEVLDQLMVMLLLEAVAVKVKLETQTELLKVELILR
tara:strand:+ start:435 stop:758 length:324 start_codon:yes stop_codon:yes gene_type:complete